MEDHYTPADSRADAIQDKHTTNLVAITVAITRFAEEIYENLLHAAIRQTGIELAFIEQNPPENQ